MPLTKFKARTEIFMYDFRGYERVRITLAPKGEVFTCFTKQTPDNKASDNGVTFNFKSGDRKESFDVLGRLVSC